jgi:hypothetical protein
MKYSGVAIGPGLITQYPPIHSTSGFHEYRSPQVEADTEDPYEDHANAHPIQIPMLGAGTKRLSIVATKT